MDIMMKILGQYDPDNEYKERNKHNEYKEWDKPVEVVVFEDSLRDKCGIVRAVKDEHGVWVNATLWKYGIMAKLKVIKERK